MYYTDPEDSGSIRAIIAVVGLALFVLGVGLSIAAFETHCGFIGIATICTYALNSLYLVLGLVTLGAGIVLVVFYLAHKKAAIGPVTD